jgi:Gpi18-like mannosyltransferase
MAAPSAALFVVSSFWALWFFLKQLGFELVQGDVISYWNDSTHWQQPFDPYHVPGYPIVIALTRGATLDRVPPEMLLVGITFTAYCAGGFVVYRTLIETGFSPESASRGLALYSIWPFVGLTHSVYPNADALATTLVFGGVYLLIRSHYSSAGTLLGLAAVTHKATWPFVALLTLALVWRSDPRTASKLIVPAVLPLTLLYVSGALSHGSLTWIVSSNLQNELLSQSSLPVLDGLLGTILRGSQTQIVKAVIVWSVVAGSAGLLLLGLGSGTLRGRLGGALAAAVLFLCLALNQLEIWAAVRFSKLLVLPAMWTLQSARPALLKNRWVWLVAIAGGLASQFVYAWYLARVYFAG